MKIFHYSLGFPPYRSGGLTKFSFDLMKKQVSAGDDVALLWPGEIELFSHSVRIKPRKIREGIRSFEIINPLPVSYDEGIKDYAYFTAYGDEEVFSRFWDEQKPDVIHVHTLMGLHKNLLVSAKKKNIRIVFTTHDFFPICPKVTMFRHGKVCEEAETCVECGVCNNMALSRINIMMLQSPLYRLFKDTSLLKILRKHHRDNFLSGDNEYNSNCVDAVESYKKLRYHYYSMLQLMDMIHYNSNVTKNVYERFFTLPYNKVISITHSDIADHRKSRNYDSRFFRIRYLGAQSAAKGFYILKDALDELWKEQQNFRLDIHFSPTAISDYMKVHDRYNYEDLESIFDDTDVLIVPSLWYETFGFTVIEALSYGVPVIISDRVGAKDILTDGAGIVIKNISSKGIKETIKDLTSMKLKEMNEIIMRNQHIMTIEEMIMCISENCYMES